MPFSVARMVPPSAWIATISTGLPWRRASVGQPLRDDLLAAERDDDHRADVGMCRSRRQASRA